LESRGEYEVSVEAPSVEAGARPGDRVASSITAFFPAYDDAPTIARLVADVEAILAQTADDYEVIVVDDGSTDGTSELLDDLANKRPHVRVVHHATNRGYGAALRTGFAEAAKEFVFYTDGDGQYDVAELTRLLSRMRPDVDVVNGYKLARADPPHRRLLGSLYNRVVSTVFQLPIRDVDCDFRLIRRRALDGVDLTASSGAICVELVHKLNAAGAVFVEVPVHHYPRAHGRSQFFTPGRVLRTAIDVTILSADLLASRLRTVLAGRTRMKERRT
jgi:glycosyltransferase involved in cell wall biosynthesis